MAAYRERRRADSRGGGEAGKTQRRQPQRNWAALDEGIPHREAASARAARQKNIGETAKVSHLGPPWQKYAMPEGLWMRRGWHMAWGGKKNLKSRP